MEQTSIKTVISSVSEKESLQLALLKLISCIAVIYIHAYTPQNSAFAAALDKLPVFHYIAEILSKYMAQVAVPVFFMVSGYIYFSKQYTQKWHVFALNKANTILFPYLLWNTLAIAYIFAAQIPESIRKIFPADKVIANFSAADWINAYIGWNNEWYPFLYPLWFLPCLFTVFILAHTFRNCFYKYDWPIWCLTAVNIAAFAYVPLYNSLTAWGLLPRTLYSLAFFAAGKFLLKYRNTLNGKLCLFISLGIFAASTAMGLAKFTPCINWRFIALYPGLIAVFVIAGKVIDKFKTLRQPLLFLSGFSFLIYLTHEFALTAVLSTAYPRLPLNFGSFLVFFICLPLLLAAMLICGGWILKKVLPKVYVFLFGGR